MISSVYSVCLMLSVRWLKSCDRWMIRWRKCFRSSVNVSKMGNRVRNIRKNRLRFLVLVRVGRNRATGMRSRTWWRKSVLMVTNPRSNATTRALSNETAKPSKHCTSCVRAYVRYFVACGRLCERVVFCGVCVDFVLG